MTLHITSPDGKHTPITLSQYQQHQDISDADLLWNRALHTSHGQTTLMKPKTYEEIIDDVAVAAATPLLKDGKSQFELIQTSLLNDEKLKETITSHLLGINETYANYPTANTLEKLHLRMDAVKQQIALENAINGHEMYLDLPTTTIEAGKTSQNTALAQTKGNAVG